MANFNFELKWQDINCLIPIYEQLGGNSTEVWLVGGEKIVIPYKTKTVLKNLAKVFAVDISQLKRKYGVLVGKRVSAPLAFHPELILLPIKIREPFAKDEGANGYIVHNKVKSCNPLEKTKTQIIFCDDTVLGCMQSVTSVNLSIAHGEIVGRECRKNLQTIVQEKEELYRVISAIVATLEKRRVGY
ncbi:MAG: hypothetical protein VR72_10730 [Clostridiaceae bacterium BRH_c20a]|nr:MAG: hypothetical protein VR72_10730 [Clostridiaceae bacterium BRH_c20a]